MGIRTSSGHQPSLRCSGRLAREARSSRPVWVSRESRWPSTRARLRPLCEARGAVQRVGDARDPGPQRVGRIIEAVAPRHVHIAPPTHGCLSRCPTGRDLEFWCAAPRRDHDNLSWPRSRMRIFDSPKQRLNVTQLRQRPSPPPPREPQPPRQPPAPPPPPRDPSERDRGGETPWPPPPPPRPPRLT
jgi:hypothetical protein